MSGEGQGDPMPLLRPMTQLERYLVLAIAVLIVLNHALDGGPDVESEGDNWDGSDGGEHLCPEDVYSVYSDSWDGDVSPSQDRDGQHLGA